LKTVAVVGLGYVGVTLAVALARCGYEVTGYDRERRVVEGLAAGRPHLYEPGIEEALRETLGRTLRVAADLRDTPADAAIICVSTPVDPATHRPNLANLRAAAQQVAEECGPETLVVVRSTVPVGASRAVVLPELLARWGRARLAFAPERTIQGQALRELTELPQVVGGLDDASLEAAVALFERLTDLKPGPSPEGASPIWRAMRNLGMAIRHRVQHGEITEETKFELAALIDELAQKIERLK